MSVKTELKSLKRRAGKLPKKSVPTVPFTSEQRAAIREDMENAVTSLMAMSEAELTELMDMVSGQSPKEQLLRRLCMKAFNRQKAIQREQEKTETEARQRAELAASTREKDGRETEKLSPQSENIAIRKYIREQNLFGVIRR